MAGLHETFARCLRERRAAAGLTQEELAEKIGRSVDMISRMERGTNAASFETLERLGRALSVQPVELLGAKPMTPTVVDKARVRLIDQVLNANPAQLQRLERVLKAID